MLISSVTTILLSHWLSLLVRRTLLQGKLEVHAAATRSYHETWRMLKFR